MKAYCCDICGSYFIATAGVPNVIVTGFTNFESHGLTERTHNQLDVCPSCADRLNTTAMGKLYTVKPKEG